MTPPSNKQTRKAAETTARERAAELKAAAARDERRRKLMSRGAIGLVGVAIVGTVVVVALASNGSGEHLTGVLPNVAANGASSAPPWVTPTDTSDRVALAGLSILPNEAVNRHDHVHVDILVDGKAVTIPAYIGIAGGANATGFAPLHTHDDTGVVHIESADAGARFTLGQVFNEWNVMFTPTQLGSLKVGGGKTLTVYVNGKALTTDPSKLELKEHQEIVIEYGTAAEDASVKVPSSYKWADGL